MRALVFDRFGGPEVLQWREHPSPVLAPGHALVRMQAIGLNFADIYRRRGDYHLAGSAPWICGYEGAGVVEAVDGAGVSVGQRVAFADSPFANAELVLVPIEKLIPLPDDIAAEQAAALLLQGLTAQYLVRDSHSLRAGEWALVHAASGGVGLLLVQMIKLLGGSAIGVVSSEAKREAALQAGAASVVLGQDDWVKRAREAVPGGDGVDVVYDSVGSTLEGSLKAARTGGQVVFFGMAGGNPRPVDPRLLMDRSLSLTGGDLWNVLRTRDDRIHRANTLFDWVRSGQLKVRIARAFPLADGAAAHAFLEGRGSLGKVLLIP
jgi:NADPH2:quinone reductase